MNKLLIDRSAVLEVYFASGIVAHNGAPRVQLEQVSITREDMSGKTASGQSCTIKRKDEDIVVHCTCERFQFKHLPAINEAYRQNQTPPIEGCKHLVALASRHLPA